MGSSFDDYVADVEARATDVQRGLLDMWTKHFEAERQRLFDVPQQLAAAREARQMTQRQLAKATGIHQSEISRIERGQISPTLETLTRLVAALGVRLAIVGADGHPVAV
jgi:ribosome-binding protein aMBF1 (putative translation factor)